jgi:outer membrane protein assembly factor BamB
MVHRLLAGIISALVLFQGPDEPHKQARQDTTVLEANGDPSDCPDVPIPPLVISPDRILVTGCNSLYMLDSKRQVVWKWATSGPAIADQPVIDSTGTIYVIADDGIRVALDAISGELKWGERLNRRANYSQIKPYRDDQYLMVINLEGYREQVSPKGDLPDELLLCKGQDEIWRKDFPANATLEVWGDRILAITSEKGRAEIVEIPRE